MNDFLSSLVSKSLGVAPTIGPRPVSLYEPWRPGGMLATAPMIDRAETERSLPQVESDTPARLERPRRESYGLDDEAPRTPARSAASPREPMRLQPAVMPPTVWVPPPVVSQPEEYAAPDGLAVATPIDRSLTSLADTAGASSSVVSVVERIERVIVDRTQSDHDRIELDHPAHERENRPLGVELIAHGDVAHAPTNKAPIVERIEHVIVDRSQPAREPAEPKRVAPTIVEHLAVQRVISEPERSEQAQITLPGIIQSTGSAPAPGAPDTQRATPARITPIVERIERIRENSAQNQVDRSHLAQATPPVIHVTIGRIEVRATPPPTPVKRAAPAQPATSLEEYLRSRSGGRR